MESTWEEQGKIPAQQGAGQNTSVFESIREASTLLNRCFCEHRLSKSIRIMHSEINTISACHTRWHAHHPLTPLLDKDCLMTLIINVVFCTQNLKALSWIICPVSSAKLFWGVGSSITYLFQFLSYISSTAYVALHIPNLKQKYL